MHLNTGIKTTRNHKGGDNAYRMRLMIPPDFYKLSLSEDLSPEDHKMILDFEMPSLELEYYAVDSIRVVLPGQMVNKKMSSSNGRTFLKLF